MKNFQLTDERLVEKICDHLKSFDKFDKLKIDVEETDIARIEFSVEIGDEFKVVETLPHRDGVLGIPEMTEDMIASLSRQVRYFEDIENLLGSKLFRKTYRRGRDQWAIGETVIDGVKYEFSLSYDSSQQCHIEIEFTQVTEGLKHESRISTDDWFDYDELEQTWRKFEKIVKSINHSKKGN